MGLESGKVGLCPICLCDIENELGDGHVRVTGMLLCALALGCDAMQPSSIPDQSHVMHPMDAR